MFINKLKLATLALFTMLTLAVISCTKDEPEPETPKVTFTVNSPFEGQEFQHNDTVKITGTIEYASGLHGYEVTIRNKADNSVQFDADQHIHGSKIEFNEFWVNNATQHSEMELEIAGILDHDGNKASKKINIHCHN